MRTLAEVNRRVSILEVGKLGITFLTIKSQGTIKIIELCKQQGIPLPEFKQVTAGFSVIFRKDVYTEDYLLGIGLNERQVKAVMYVKDKRSITVSSFKIIVPSVSEKTLYRDLQDLVQKNILKGLGEKKDGHTNYYNGHLSDISDIFQTFIRHDYW